jgi:hypothetical protein
VTDEGFFDVAFLRLRTETQEVEPIGILEGFPSQR